MKPLNPSTVAQYYDTESEWLAMRAQDITSTESAALFGASPYLTKFELFHQKQGTLEPSFSANERMRWGNRLESAIALGIAEDNGWEIEPLKSYWRIPDKRIGSSFDYVITSLGEPAHLEIKNVDSLAYRDGWIVGDEEEEPQAPVQIELQVQHQMLVSGFKRAYIGALIGGNRVALLERQADAEVHAAILKRCAAFWDDIAAGRVPSASYPEDAECVRRIHSHAEPGKILTALTDEHADLHMLIRRYHEAQRAEKLADEDKKTAAAQILEMIGDHEKVLTPFGSVSAGVVADNPGTEVTQEMVGTFIGARRGFRAMRFYPKRGIK